MISRASIGCLFLIACNLAPARLPPGPPAKKQLRVALQRADLLFRRGRLTEALVHYRKVSVSGAPELVARARHQIGHCYLKQGRFRAALAQFVLVLRNSPGDPRLLRAARRGFVEAYSHDSEPGKAYDFLLKTASNDPNIAKQMFLQLAALHLARARPVKAVMLWKEARRRWPRSPDRCRWVHGITQAAATLGDKNAQLASLRWMREIMLSLSKQLGSAHQETKACRRSFEKVTRSWTVQWRRDALTSKDAQALRDYDRIFKTYIASFPQSAHRDLMRFDYVVLLSGATTWRQGMRSLYGSERQRRALAKQCDLYVKQVRPPHGSAAKGCIRKPGDALSDPRCVDRATFESRRRKVARMAVELWHNMVRQHLRAISWKLVPFNKPGRCKQRTKRQCLAWELTFPKQSISADQLRYTVAVSTYLKLVPRTPWSAYLSYCAGYIYWLHNHTHEALVLLKRLLRVLGRRTKHPHFPRPREVQVMTAIRIVRMSLMNNNGVEARTFLKVANLALKHCQGCRTSLLSKLLTDFRHKIARLKP